MDELEDQDAADADDLPPRIEAFLQRLYRDPRYLVIGKAERFGRELIAFVEGCTILSATGEVRGQALLNCEYERRSRPDGQRPYGEDSLLDHYLSPRGAPKLPLGEEELAELREESWQYYVRRNFAFLLKDFSQAREDAEHNLGIWNLVEQSDASEAEKWSYLKWWPWIERDRAIAQALWHLQHGQAEDAATELYRAQRSIEQFGERYAAEYAQEEPQGRSLCAHMRQHIASLVEVLREEGELPVSLEERLDLASARGDVEEVERLREEMIQRATEESE